ncbi:hypothetical protein PG999_008540 [Apiospora kogelbergensis]|uniref:Uncharacterized protein n=1 Tax=Apiospora kogelbergensis TaxID=1337665 RepID=A0AAW0QRM6_9PEZI
MVLCRLIRLQHWPREQSMMVLFAIAAEPEVCPAAAIANTLFPSWTYRTASPMDWLSSGNIALGEMSRMEKCPRRTGHLFPPTQALAPGATSGVYRPRARKMIRCSINRHSRQPGLRGQSPIASPQRGIPSVVEAGQAALAGWIALARDS